MWNLLFLQTWSFRNWSLSSRHLPLPRIEGTLNLRPKCGHTHHWPKCVGIWTVAEKQTCSRAFNLTCQFRLEFSRIATGLYHTEVRDCCASSTWRRSLLRAGLKAWQVPGTNQPPQLQNWALEGAGNYTRPEFQGNATCVPKGSTPPTQLPSSFPNSYFR
jgi:hypothetical protein